MITYLFTSNNFAGQSVYVQYSKYDSKVREEIGFGTFPFEYTTNQKGGTYFFYVPKVDRTFPKEIPIPPFDIVPNLVNLPDCDVNGIINDIPSCDLNYTFIEVPVCDIDYEVTSVTPTPTPTNSFICPSISGVTVGPAGVSGGQYTLVENPSSNYLYQFDTIGTYLVDIPSQSTSILPDGMFLDEITVLVPSPFWFGGACQYCFNINSGVQVDCNTVILSQTPTPSFTITPTITPTPSVTSTQGISPTPTPSVTPTNTSTPTPTNTSTPTPTPTLTPTNLPDIVFIGSFGKTNNVVGVISESFNNNYYLTTTASTDIYDSTYTNIDTISVTGSSVNDSIYDSNNNKLFFGDIGSTKIDVYELSTPILKQTNIFNGTFALTFDSTNNLLGISDGEGVTDVTIIDTINDTVNGTITGLTAGWKGDITSDNNGYMYIVGGGYNRIDIIDAINLVSAGTITTTTNIGTRSRILYNPNNNYLYVLQNGGALEYTTTATTQGVISISGYSGINTTMVYDTVKDRIYIGNISNTGVFGVITVDCSTNTIISFTNNMRTGISTVDDFGAKLYYDSITQELLVVNVLSPSVFRFTT